MIFRTGVARVFLGCLIIGGIGFASALQRPEDISRSQVLASPPRIPFADWKKEAELVNGVEYLETFPSPFKSGSANNDTVPLRVFVPNNPSGPVPVVLIAHYWGATDLKAETSLAADLNQRGIGAAILTLPFHMERTPPGARSGDMAIRPDPVLLEQMMYQSTQDARRALDFLDQRPEFDHGEYGMVGISLGALIAALAYATDNRIVAATFALGGVDLAHIVWNSSRVVGQREVLKKKGWDEAKLRDALAAVEPLNFMPRVVPAKTLVIVGKFDTVIPAKSTAELVEKLKEPQVIRLETGHYGGIFVQGKILRTVADFFFATMNGHDYAAPSRFSAITFRFGGLLAYPQGADLGAGVDVFHIDPSGNRFGSVFVTPRGVRFFLGQSLAGGLSVGLVGSTRGVGAGLMWSIVL